MFCFLGYSVFRLTVTVHLRVFGLNRNTILNRIALPDSVFGFNRWFEFTIPTGSSVNRTWFLFPADFLSCLSFPCRLSVTAGRFGF